MLFRTNSSRKISRSTSISSININRSRIVIAVLVSLMLLIGRVKGSFVIRGPIRFRFPNPLSPSITATDTDTVLTKIPSATIQRASLATNPRYCSSSAIMTAPLGSGLSPVPTESPSPPSPASETSPYDGDGDGTMDAKLSVSKPILAKIVTDIHACGQRLREGLLVAFPTETVYGLGCDALNENAIMKVFQAKERPLTDPLIVHVLNCQDAFDLWQATHDEGVVTSETSGSQATEGSILRKLCQDFWPGPLTLVARATTGVPSTLMASTGYCACRSPSHPLARRLLQVCQCPVAAPSANKFGHVSPTTALHVWDDLQNEDVWILRETNDDDDNNNMNDYHEEETPNNENNQPSAMDGIKKEHRKHYPTCDVGVESTVAKLEMNEDGVGILTVLRQGAVSLQQLRNSVRGYPVQVQASLQRATADDVPNVAPGQTLRHYSPHKPSFLVSTTAAAIPGNGNSLVQNTTLSKAVIVDYGGQLGAWKTQACQYRDLSPSGNSTRAAQVVFDTLRWAEQVTEADFILFPNYTPGDEALAMAVKDRLTRAASGVIVNSLDDIIMPKI